MRTVVLLFILCCLLGHATAIAEDRSASDLGAWFKSLTVPSTGGSCCDLSDCRRLAPRDVRVTLDGYMVRIDGAWLPVPAKAILPRKANPTGDAVVCYLPGRGILCFVRPPEA